MEEKLNAIIEKLENIEKLLQNKASSYGEYAYGRAKFEYEAKQANCIHEYINYITGTCNTCGKLMQFIGGTTNK